MFESQFGLEVTLKTTSFQPPEHLHYSTEFPAAAVGEQSQCGRAGNRILGEIQKEI